jgi:hypothetical protein
MAKLSDFTDCPHASQLWFDEKTGRWSVQCALLSDAIGWPHRSAGRCRTCPRDLVHPGKARVVLLSLLRVRITHLWTWEARPEMAAKLTKDYAATVAQYRDATSKDEAATALVEATRRGLTPERAEAAATAAEITQEVEDALSRSAPA